MPRPTYQSFNLSGSTNYLPINITANTVGSANLIHTASALDVDELWLDAYNYSNSDTFLYLLLGGSASHQVIKTPVFAGRGMIPLLKGQRFTGSVVISAYADSANAVSVVGQVNRIVFV